MLWCVILGTLRRGEPVELLRDLTNGWAVHPAFIREHAHRQPGISKALHPGLRAGLVVAGKFDPLKRDIAALEKIADLVAFDRAELAIDFHQ